MTSSTLADRLAGYRFVGDKQIQFSPDDVYLAGTLAQKDICILLRLLELTCYHVAVAGQERYQYQSVTITGAADNGSGLVRITAPSHGFQTGDSVVIGGIVGTTEANNTQARPTWTVTRVTANTFDLQGSTFANAWTSGGIAYHALWAALQIRSGRQISPNIFSYFKKSADWVEVHRQDWADPSQPNSQTVDVTQVTTFYELYTEPFTVGFLGVGNATWTSEFRYFRKPFPHEDLSATVDPLIPTIYDSLMLIGTEYWMLRLRSEQNARQMSRIVKKEFDMEIQKAMSNKTKQRIIYDVTQESLEW